MKKKLGLLFLIGLFLLTTAPVWGDTIDLNPSKDAYLDQNQPTQNNGTGTFLSIKSQAASGQSSAKNRRIVLQFDLPDLPGCTIDGATLLLTLTAVSGQTSQYELYYASDDTWDENVVTWNSASTSPGLPIADNLLDTVSTSGKIAGNTLEWSGSLKDKVIAEYGMNQKISLIIKDQTEDENSGARESTFASRESSPSPILRLSYTCEAGDQGCSHGFWKNHPLVWNENYTPETLVKDVFSNASLYTYTKVTKKTTESYNLGDKSLQDALEFPGGPDATGAAMILLRNAVAALLNADHPDVSYPISRTQLISDVNTALESKDRETMLALERTLELHNNLGCPLGD